jgi:uncharacterized protein YjiS (DUF1127 family)
MDWRRRRKLRARLHGLSDSELMDIGLSRGEIDYVVSRPIGAPDPHSS